MSVEEYQHIEEALNNKEVMVTTSGTSMYPMLRHRRDMIVISAVNGELRKNDVALYRSKSGKLILHRILQVKDDLLIIRGDNLLNKECVKKNQIIGVLKSFYRDGKFFDCETDKKYKLYIGIMRASFPVRYIWKKFFRPFLSRIKHIIIK